MLKGSIQGLPRGFSTNGAMVEEGSKVIIASSESTIGYYRFDLNTLQAEKLTSSSSVYNASDLANANLAFEKNKKEKPQPREQVQATKTENEEPLTESLAENNARPGIAVYPNPVTSGYIRLSFNEQPAGRYRVQLLDITGRVIGSSEVNVNGPAQVEEFRFPELSVKGNYLIRVTNELNKINITDKIVVQ
jgi:hypothetical protein